MTQADSQVDGPDALPARQVQRLGRLLRELEGQNPFWTSRLRDCGVNNQTLESIDELRRLPLLTKKELVEDQQTHPPFGSNLTYPLEKYTRLHQTSGTTGRPMRWLDTPQSWEWFLKCWEQIYQRAGVRADDILAFPFSFGPFIGFWAAFDGALRQGNLSLSLGGMGSEARLRMILDLNATVVCCTPTYALRLAEVANECNFDLARSRVRLLIVAGEPGASVPPVRSRIESAWGARLIDHWGMTDAGSLAVEPVDAPGGLVLLEEECIAEFIDPQTSLPVAPGELGELVITNLGRWGQPVLRYRTGDLVRARFAEGVTGERELRLEGGILGRVDDMVTIRGNNVFPSSIEAILREFPEVAEYRATVITRRSMPHLRVEFEPAGGAAIITSEALSQLQEEIDRRLSQRLHFRAEVIAVQELPRFEHKGKRFFRTEGNAS